MADGFPRRILVVGITGSGKTTMARAISSRLGLPHVELDELFWGPSWQPNPDDQFRQSVISVASLEEWVMCGNYFPKLNDVTWGTADLVVWLDLPRRTTLRRLIMRTIRRISKRQALWHGNRETMRNVFFSKDSLLVWWWKTQRKEPERTLGRLSSAPQARVIRLMSPREARRWLKTLEADL